MSLIDGLRSPHSPLRRFLDRELSAGPGPLRQNYRAQHRTDHVLLPPPGVGTEAGTVGTAIDQRLRLAFTAAAPVDDAALIGIECTGRFGGHGEGLRMRAVGNELAARLTETVQHLDLDNRDLPLDRAQDEEEDLARMLIAAAWYQVMTRNSIGFASTPLAGAALEDPGAFTLTRLLELPHPDMVDDVLNQLHKTAHSPLEDLRARTRTEECHGGPTFAGARITADADLAVDGLLLDFKSTRHPLKEMSQRTAWQLAGYLLLDATDAYRIDTVGLYLTRTGVLASWPVEDFLDLLSTCSAPAAATSPSCAACSPNSSPAATDTPMLPTSPPRKRSTTSGGCSNAWPQSPLPAVARPASSPCPRPPAASGSSAPPDAADGPRSCATAG
ncbi:hypothetical protein [Streptomyces monomycini]|uniref:hypothetical protein n=1 Tax=Streptomyces monomycini TaxID=371720 RepID=UPI0007C48DDD|nr:hypothetical protein [Streptomyces monomycini]